MFEEFHPIMFEWIYNTCISIVFSDAKYESLSLLFKMNYKLNLEKLDIKNGLFS